MRSSNRQLTVLQGKFSAYLSWSQPFLHSLISGLDDHVRNVILCNRTENLDRFPIENIERLPTRYLVKPRLAVLTAGYLRRTWQPDVLHGHFGWSGLRMLLLKQILRIPLVVTFGGRDAGLQMKLPDFGELYLAMLDACDEIICVSRDLRDKLVESGVDAERIHVVYRGTDLTRFEFVDRSERPADAPVNLLMVGRVVEKKGHRFALEALEPLVSEGRRVKLTIVGEGEAYHEVRKLRKRLGLMSHVNFAGSTDHAGVRAAMREADLLVHCSVTPESGDMEGIPNVVVEAQAMGLPVIGTWHGGIGEAVRDGETGLLVPERDVKALSEALVRLVEDHELRLRMGREARAFVDREFNLDRQVEQHLAIYEKAVAAAATNPEWKTRDWLPANYMTLANRALLAQGIRHPSEFSLAELLERLLWARWIDQRLTEAGTTEGATTAEQVAGAAFAPEASRVTGAASAADATEPEKSRRRGMVDRMRWTIVQTMAPRLGRDDRAGSETWFERLYNLKVHVPQAIKFPVKITLGRFLVWAIEQRHRRRHGQELSSLERLDTQVLEYFRKGGDLDSWAQALAAANEETGQRAVNG